MSIFPELTADEAAALFEDGMTVGLSAFTAAGAVKAVPRALAARARERHAAGEAFRVRLLTGASTGPTIDDALAEADAISWRAPFQSSAPLRRAINEQRTEFIDMHLSHLPQMIEAGFVPELDVAVVEAVDVTRDGRVFLSTSVGASPSFLRHAKMVIVELNAYHPPRVAEMHDIAVLPPPPRRNPIPISHAMARIGTPFATVDPKKIVGVVRTDEPDEVSDFDPPATSSLQIAGHVADFLVREMRAGRVPDELLPLQAGVGNVSNAVMSAIGADDRLPPFCMFSEVFQDSLVPLMRAGQLTGASTTSLTVSNRVLREIYDDFDFFAPRIVMRPQELSNNPGLIRRLGVIAINTALEVDIYGNANSTHVCGTRLMNGIGGSGDFVRNAFLSILVCPSIAKDGAISTVVPMVSHCDHTDHSVQVIVTEQGCADLRGLGPRQRARTIIDQCAHPMYRDYLHRYLEAAPMGHMPHDLGRCFELHRNLLEHGHMLPGGGTST